MEGPHHHSGFFRVPGCGRRPAHPGSRRPRRHRLGHLKSKLTPRPHCRKLYLTCLSDTDQHASAVMAGTAHDLAAIATNNATSLGAGMQQE